MEALLELLENIGDFDDLVLMLESYGINLEESDGTPRSFEDVMTDIYNCEE